jgi:esterase/lipase superfamily enzyme
MPQDLETLHGEFERLRRLARRRIWTPPPPSARLELRLTTLDSPDDVPFEPLVSLLPRLRQITGLSFHLTAGGYGCFDMALVAQSDAGSVSGPAHADTALNAAVTQDADVQRYLNELRLHTVRVITPHATHQYRGYDDLEIAVATNRNRIADSTGDIRRIFGAEAAATTTYGLARVSISDLSKRQPRESLAKRTWRVAKGLFGTRRDHEILVRSSELYDKSSFSEVLRPRINKGAVVIVHGYATRFEEAFDSCVLGMHRIRLHDLGLLPVLFSWPSHGSPARYLDDTDDAEDSEGPLLETLDLLSDLSSATPPSVVAHSHGNKILVRSLTTKVHGRPERSRWLKTLVLIEPDMGQKFLEKRASLVAEAADRIVLYHSSNDRALQLSGYLFKSLRAGRAGMRPEEVEGYVAERLEIVDATAVAVGLMRHAPHIESAEVITDLYYLFQGQAPQARHGLRAVSAARWSIVSPLAR